MWDYSTKMVEIPPTLNNHHLNDNENGYNHPTSGYKYVRALRRIALALSLSTLTVLIAVLGILDAFPFQYKSEAREATILFIGWVRQFRDGQKEKANQHNLTKLLRCLQSLSFV